MGTVSNFDIQAVRNLSIPVTMKKRGESCALLYGGFPDAELCSINSGVLARVLRDLVGFPVM